MNTSTFPLLIALLFGVLSSTAFSQSTLDNSSLRHDTAARIAREHQVTLDWRQKTLLDLMDTEARLSAVKRIRSTYGVAFEWRKTTLLELMDAESRMGAAKRISQATKTTIDWKQHTLMQLMEMEARLSGVDVDTIKKQAAESATRRVPPAVEKATGRGLGVYVIAPSVSTSMEARSIRMKKGWVESDLRQADAILVVVRSMLFNPLDYTYDSIKELKDDAESQLNISGEKFHIYIYSIDDKMKVSQQRHVSYKAND